MPARARLLTVAALALLLAACSTSPPKKSVYYQDDGPPDKVPADVAAIPDAEPRVEPPHRGSSKPYTALGRTYTPLSGDVSFSQRGMASWYGRQFHGNRTASGEIYDMLGMTAAHPTLPLPSYVRVTNVRNGRSVIVRVNDRGPFKHDRVIDLSYAAAAKLGIAAMGTGEVEIERITTAQIASGDYRRGRSGVSSTVAAVAPPASTARATAPVQSIQSIVASPAVSGPVVAAGAEAAPALTEPLNSSSVATEQARGWAVQLGAFAQESNADALAGRTAALLAFVDNSGELPARAPRVERDGGVFRVLVGAMSDRDSALSLARELERLLERPTTVLLR
jgi:rare lipoprotein A